MDSSGSQEKKSIPRFASFKPPPAPPSRADPPSDRRSRELSHRDEKSKHRSRHRSHRESSQSRDRRTEREEAKSHRREAHPRDESVRYSSPPPKPVVKENEDDISGLFVIDRKGDKYNLIYGTLHRYNVPLYHRVGRGNVLGLSSRYRIDRDTADGDALILRTDFSRTDGKRSQTKSVFSGLDKQRARLLRVRRDALTESAIDVSRDFIPLSATTGSRRKGMTGDIDTDDEKYAYRSIHGKAKRDEDVPSDLEATSDTDFSEAGLRVDPDEEIKSLNAELLKSINQNPTDIAAWLRLIDHQELLLRGAERSSRPLTSAERQSLADIKISLYEKALKKAGNNPSKDRLLLGLIEEGAKLWDTKKLSAQWQTILRANPQYISLWVRYLDFRQTEFLDFTYERCFNTYLECLKLNRPVPDSPEKSHVQIYLFLRLTLFIREAGFTEHAVALWQALFEAIFFRPEELGALNDEKTMPALIDFWESEVTRIGEVGAKGWRSGENPLLDPQTFIPTSRVDLRSIFASWAVCEREWTCNSRLPARSLDEFDDDDPYRVVIASDLQGVLPLVWHLDSADELINGYLYFCQLPPIKSPANLETISTWDGDNFLRNDLMSNMELTLEDWLSNQLQGTESGTLSPVSFPHPNFIHTTDTLFANEEAWFSSLRSWTKAILNPRSDIDPDWIRRTLRLLVEANPRNDDLAEYTLAVELACNGKEAKKYAKSLLKKRSSNLRLYNSYALIESRSGNQTAADHVWSTTLSMSKTFPDKDRVDSVLLWHTWAWESLGIRKIAQASYLLLSMPQNSVDLKAIPTVIGENMFSATNLLKTQKFLSDAQENVLMSRKANIFVACTDCLALLTYLAQSLDMNKALEAYNTALNRLHSIPDHARSFKSFTTELLHQARARLIYYHVRTSSLYKPSHIRTLLSESISLFPHNTIFLSLFAWNESRFRIEERVRDVVREVTSESKHRISPNNTLTTTQQAPITTHLFSIYTELLRPVYAGSTLHSARAAFEKAIGSTTAAIPTHSSNNNTASARSSLALWKLYILFELSRNEVARAKNVFYRAVRACPWSKELVMLAFTHLRADVIRTSPGSQSRSRSGEGMGFDELRRVYNVLVEKELRIHVDVEEEIEEVAQRLDSTVGSGMPIDMPEDAESEDERMDECK